VWRQGEREETGRQPAGAEALCIRLENEQVILLK
jgi:hypothetical protein